MTLPSHEVVVQLDADRRAVAHHEIGHAVTALAIGLPVHEVWLAYQHHQRLLLSDWSVEGRTEVAIGLKLFSLSANALGFLDVREIARPTMEALAARQHATCNLAVLDGHDVLYVEKVEDRSNPVRLVTHVGTRLPAHVTSLGKVLVAEMPESSRKLWISEHDFTKFTSQTRTTPATFTRDLAAYRRDGFAVDAREFHDAIHGFAAPVTDRAGTAVAARSLTTLGTRLSRDARTEIGTEVCAAAAEISRNLTTGGVLGIGDET